jgi:hypothetical protein
MTVLGGIFAEIDARLAALAGELTGSYEREPSGDPDLFPALSGHDGGDEVLPDQETGVTRLALLFTVAGLVQGSSGPEAHAAMLALHARVVLALCGDEGSNLGGVPGVELIELTGQRRVDVAELANIRRLGFEQDFSIQYSTVRGDPSQAPA